MPKSYRTSNRRPFLVPNGPSESVKARNAKINEAREARMAKIAPEAIALREQKLKMIEIGERLGVNRCFVAETLKFAGRYDLVNRPLKHKDEVTDAERDTILKMADEGFTRHRISVATERNIDTVRRVIHRHRPGKFPTPSPRSRGDDDGPLDPCDQWRVVKDIPFIVQQWILARAICGMGVAEMRRRYPAYSCKSLKLLYQINKVPRQRKTAKERTAIGIRYRVPKASRRSEWANVVRGIEARRLHNQALARHCYRLQQQPAQEFRLCRLSEAA